MAKKVMIRAWEIAKEGVKKFGGKVRQYFAAALSIAWEEIKKMNNQIARFTKEWNGNTMEFEVFATENGSLKIRTGDVEEFTRVEKNKNQDYGYMVRGEIADMVILAANAKPRKKGAAIGLMHESAKTAEEKLAAYVDAQQLERYKKMDVDKKITLEETYYAQKEVYISAGDSAYFKELSKKIAQVDWKEYVRNFGHVEYDYELSVTYSLRRDQMDEFIRWVDEQLLEKEQRQQAAKEKEAARIAELVKQARETGEKQIVRSWSEECNCRNLDCDIDNVYELIDADGNITTERVHTY